MLTGLISLGLATAATAATNDVGALLQKGLFEEEATHHLDAAIRAYQAVVVQTDQDHQFAATAVFHLAECYRKLGQTNEAAAHYQRILRDFSDQTELVRLSRANLGPAASPVVEASKSVAAAPVTSEADEIKRIQTLIKESPDLINAEYTSAGGTSVRSPLHLAARDGSLNLARFLLTNRANLNLPDSGGRLPLHVAVLFSHPDVVELFLDQGADPNAPEANKDQFTALHRAVDRGSKALAEVLLTHQANVNAVDASGNTPLHAAAGRGFRAVAEVLLSQGTKLDLPNTDQATPLMISVQSNMLAMAEFLLSQGAAVNYGEDTGRTALVRAVELQRPEFVRLLLARGAKVNAFRPENSEYNAGYGPLHAAVEKLNPELVRLLLAAGADPNAIAASFWQGFGWPVNSPSGGGSTRPPGVGVPIGIPGAPGSMPGYPASNQTPLTPLLRAATLDAREIADLLLQAKAVVDARVVSSGATPLMLAAQYGKSELVTLLLASGAEVDATDRTHHTALHYAMLSGSASNAMILLAHGAGVDLVDDTGATALHYAAYNGRPDLVALLMSQGANVRLMNNLGLSALDLALNRNPQGNNDFSNNLSNNLKGVAALLRQHGALSYAESFTLRVTRGVSSPLEIFRRDRGGLDRHTLFELLAELYSGNSVPRGGVSGGFKYGEVHNNFRFPDFDRIEITRLTPAGTKEKLKVAVEHALRVGDCAGDIPLEWGDIVEIPEQDHRLDIQWQQLPDDVIHTLIGCLGRPVRLLVKDQDLTITLYPVLRDQSLHFGSQVAPATGAPPSAAAPAESLGFYLNRLVRSSNLLRASSDLTRVKVKRVGADGKPATEVVFNLETSENNDLWLRAGDVVEVPEKP